MNIACDKHLHVAWFATKVRPPAWSATAIVKGTYALRPDLPAVAAEEAELVSGDLHVDDDRTGKPLRYSSDFAPLKTRGDALLNATAHGPGYQPAAQFTVRARIGPVDKSLRIEGPRKLQAGPLGRTLSEPQPIAAVPVTYAFAEGGLNSRTNPYGRPIDAAEMPLIQYMGRPAGRGREKDPAGYGPLALLRGNRVKMTGTYDRRWERERWPWFPADFDWDFFNAAPEDQQVDGYFRGDEPLEFDNLHAVYSSYRAWLPGHRARCFLNERLSSGEMDFREVSLNLDTVWIDLESERLVLVWRGLADVRTFPMKEIEGVFATTESLADAPLPAGQYREKWLVVPAAKPDDIPAGADENSLAFDRSMREMEVRLAEAESELADAEGFIAELEAEAAASLEAQKAAMPGREFIPTAPTVTELRPPDEDAGLVAFLAEVAANHPEHAQSLQTFDQSAQVELEAESQSLEQEAAAVESELAAMFPPKASRESVERHAADGEPLAGQDLAGLDLSGLDLSGADLTGSDLSGANLENTSLAGANLGKVNLSAANLTGANLSEATLDGADLTGATLTGATLHGMSIAWATLADIELEAADFTGCRGRGADFSRSKLPAARFENVSLPQAVFDGCSLDGASFRNGELAAASFVGAVARGVCMDGADLSRLQAMSVDMGQSSFREIQGECSVWEESCLDGSDFSRAALVRARFASCSLASCVFERANVTAAAFDDSKLDKAKLSRANAMRATFDRAEITDANVDESNFYEAGFWEARITNTSFDRANTRSTLKG